MRIILTVALLMICFGCSNQAKETSSLSDSSSTSTGKPVAQNEEGSEETVETEEGSEEEPDCIFDLAAQTDEFIKETEEFRNYAWDSLSKTATIILENGDTLYAQRGGCYHFTYSGRLVTKEKHEIMDTVFWLNKGKWMADRIFRDYDKKLVDSLIRNKIYTVYNQNGNLQVLFEGDHGYSEFSQYTKPKGEWTETEIMFYVD
jgi:hypothetical protein